MKIQNLDHEFVDLGSDFSSRKTITEIDVHRGIFDYLDLRDVRFLNCNLRGSYFDWVDLTGAAFESCNLATATFQHSNLRKVQMHNCILAGAVFDQANLYSCVITESDFGNASFSDANLSGSELDGRRVESAVFSRTIFDENTKFPADITSIPFGMIERFDRLRIPTI